MTSLNSTDVTDLCDVRDTFIGRALPHMTSSHSHVHKQLVHQVLATSCADSPGLCYLLHNALHQIDSWRSECICLK